MIITILSRLETYLLRTSLKIKTHSILFSLCNAEGVSKLLGETLRETFQNDVTPEEKKWIDRIELLREKLNSSGTEISILDYGAGKPGHNSIVGKTYGNNVISKTIGEVCKRTSKSYFWSLILFKLIRKFKPYICLELGTGLGISASYQAAALALNGKGKIITLEGSESLVSIAKQHFYTLGLDNAFIIPGKFQDTLDGVLESNRSFGYVFIDGHHDEKATLRYYQQVLPFLSNDAIMVFDDISWSKGMKRAWKNIIADERVKTSIDLWQMGICVIEHNKPSREDNDAPQFENIK